MIPDIPPLETNNFEYGNPSSLDQKYKANINYIVSSSPAWAMLDPVTRNKKTKNNKKNYFGQKECFPQVSRLPFLNTDISV